MPVWPDVSYYDLCARNLLSGGVHYRDVFETNLPGMTWLHVLVRSLLGWSSEAIRAVDLVIVAANIWLLARWWRGEQHSTTIVVWMAVLLFGFYLSTPEICHCQRDTWMLLPALIGLYLRRRQVARLTAPKASVPGALPWALVEGLCWGAAVWIKPQVSLPALLGWLVSAVLISRGVARGWRRALADATGLLAGGLAAGGLGVLWLWHSGAWPAFLDVFLDWNREYFPTEHLLARAWLPFLRFFPWGLIHVVALPLAVVMIWRGLTLSSNAAEPGQGSQRVRQALLAALYLGWLLQSICLQHVFEYIHVPAVLLALTLVAGWEWPAEWKALWIPVALSLGAAAMLHPLVKLDRLKLWPDCWKDGATPQLQDQLALTQVAGWRDLQRVAKYLRDQGVKDGELTSYDWRTASLYVDLDLVPSTRFPFLDITYANFTRHRGEIRHALAASHQRFVVTDLTLLGGRLTVDQASVVTRYVQSKELALPPHFPNELKPFFPWNEPIVFRAGRYAVHRVEKPVEKLRADD
jgi:hypothetical protein